jgi:ketosteroid isomerase-like protein
MTTKQQVKTWVEDYVRAWTTGDRQDIERLFTEDAEYHEWPYETAWLGRAEIVKGWLGRHKWQEGGWDFEWSILMINGDTAAIEGTGVYRELGTFANLWTVTFNAAGTCRVFRMWNVEGPGPAAS